MAQNIKKDYLWNTIGVLFQNALSPLLIVIVTRVNGIDDSGVFSFAFSLAIIFWSLAMWGGRTYQVSDVKKVFKVQSYVLMRVILAVGILIAAALFCIINDYDFVKTSIIFTLVFMKVLESIADAVYGVMQTNDRLFIAGRSLVYKSLSSILTFTGVDVLTGNVVLAATGIVVVNALIILLYDIPKTRQLQRIGIKKKDTGLYIKEAFTIMRRTVAVSVVSFLAAFSLNIPRYFLDMQHPEEIGYFGIIAMPVTLVVLLVTFLLQPNIVNFSRQLDSNQVVKFKSAVNKIILSTFGIGAVVLIVTYFIGVELLSVIFGVDFSEYKTALMIITSGAIVSALVSVFINLLTVLRKLTVQVSILALTSALLIGVSLLFMKDIGIVESVSLFAATTFLQAVLFSIVYLRSVRGLKNETT